MTTRRKIRNELEQLTDENNDHGDDPVIMNLASIDNDGQWPTKDEAQHPELVVNKPPENNPKRLSYAVPNHIPEKYLEGAFLTVYADESREHYGIDRSGNSRHEKVSVATLWDSLSDEDLEREYEYRAEHDEPIPDILKR